MSEQDSSKTIEERIAENIARGVQSYEVDGERTTLADPLKQIQAYQELRKMRAARNPLAAIIPMKIPSGSGER